MNHKNFVGRTSIIGIAIPIMLSNLSTPLVGLVDTAVLGQSVNPSLIGGVAVGATMFSLIFWAFGFLRMANTGLAAQAVGAGNSNEVKTIFLRGIFLSIFLGGVLIILKKPILSFIFLLIDTSDEIKHLARQYYEIRIWAAPVTFINYVVLGWLIGIGKSKVALGIQIFLNTLNVAFDWYLVILLDEGIEGVAIGTLLAEFSAAGLGLFIILKGWFQEYRWSHVGDMWNLNKLWLLLNVSKDICIRSFALLLVFVWFTSQSAKAGELILAANAILMHFITCSAFLLDGFAMAAESLAGRAKGAKNKALFLRVCADTLLWGILVAIVISLFFLYSGGRIITLMTVNVMVRETAEKYLIWASLAPVVATVGYQLDGIFLGATWTKQMVYSMALSTILFFLTWWLFKSIGNHGLWLAIYSHFIARAVTLTILFPRLLLRDFP